MLLLPFSEMRDAVSVELMSASDDVREVIECVSVCCDGEYVDALVPFCRWLNDDDGVVDFWMNVVFVLILSGPALFSCLFACATRISTRNLNCLWNVVVVLYVGNVIVASSSCISCLLNHFSISIFSS
jgi:hypothetical protein